MTKKALQWHPAFQSVIQKHEKERDTIIANLFHSGIPVDTIAASVNESTDNVIEKLKAAGVVVEQL